MSRKCVVKLIIIVGFLFLITIILIQIKKSGYQYYEVKEVIDGDTIVLSNGMTVRYLGIDAPELNHRNVKEECGGKQATQFNKQLLLNKKVRLEQDKVDKDIHGRLLRYVYTQENKLINHEMIKNGWAQTFILFPSYKYSNKLKNALKVAKNKKLGLWSSCFPFNIRKVRAQNDDKNKCLTIQNVRDFIGEERCIIYSVSKVFQSTENMQVVLLKSDEMHNISFNTVIFPAILNKFQIKYKDLSKNLTGKTVKLYGLIQLYRGNPEVIANDPNKISILY